MALNLLRTFSERREDAIVIDSSDDEDIPSAKKIPNLKRSAFEAFGRASLGAHQSISNARHSESLNSLSTAGPDAKPAHHASTIIDLGDTDDDEDTERDEFHSYQHAFAHLSERVPPSLQPAGSLQKLPPEPRADSTTLSPNSNGLLQRDRSNLSSDSSSRLNSQRRRSRDDSTKDCGIQSFIDGLNSARTLALSAQTNSLPLDNHRNPLPSLASRSSVTYSETAHKKLPSAHRSERSGPIQLTRDTPREIPPEPGRYSNFNNTNLASQKGRAFTNPELCMIVYLKETLLYSWSEVDAKLGRSQNCCATRYLRNNVGMKEPHIKQKHGYPRAVRLLDRLFASNRVAPVNEVIRSLSIELGQEPLLLEAVKAGSNIVVQTSHVNKPAAIPAYRDQIQRPVGRQLPRLQGPVRVNPVSNIDDRARRLVRHNRNLALSYNAFDPSDSDDNDYGGQTFSGPKTIRRSRWRVSHSLQRSINPQSEQARIQAYQHTFAPVLEWKGASSDVHSVAWAPDDDEFACAAIIDYKASKYPCNSIHGSVSNSTLSHTVGSHTLTTVAFSAKGTRLYTAGYDGVVRAYRSGGDVAPVSQLDLGMGKLAMLDAHTIDDKLIAVGGQSVSVNSVAILAYDEEFINSEQSLFSEKAREAPQRQIFPSSIKWGRGTSQDYLLAGFASHSADIDAEIGTTGEIKLWDIAAESNTNLLPWGTSGNIFDVAWSASGEHLAFARPVQQAARKGSKTQVDVRSMLGSGAWATNGLNVECPALDINCIQFCPYSDRYITAAATDGNIYVWDVRRPDLILHTLCHSEPIIDLDPANLLSRERDREKEDSGVSFCTWGSEFSALYSGSSDGVVSVWDVRRAPEDAHTRSITLQSGIACGAFNSDYSRLLIGQHGGSITVLERSAGVEFDDGVKTFNALPIPPATQILDGDSGIAISRDLVNKGRIDLVPHSTLPIRRAVQGPRYIGPYSKDAPSNRIPAPEPEKEDEPITDSNRSQDRIPDTIRQPPSATLRVGQRGCDDCGRLIHREREIDAQDEKALNSSLCEQCNFACLQCGHDLGRVDLDQGLISCERCGIDWQAGSLGYRRVTTGHKY